MTHFVARFVPVLVGVVVGALEVAAQTPPARWGAAVVYDPVRGETVLTSDGAPGTPLQDTWRLRNGTWSVAASPIWPQLGGPASTFDRQRGVVVMVMSDSTWMQVWEWNGAAWSQLQGAAPPARVFQPICFDAARGESVLFGGWTGGPNLNDTWSWNGTAWSQRSPASAPPARRHHSMAYDQQRQRVVLFGGWSDSLGTLGDTWEWDGTNWLQRSPTASPPARWGHALAWDSNRGKVVAFGGTSQPYASSSVRNDTWQYDGVTWTPVTSAISPPARMRIEHSMDFDESRQAVVLFGGRAGDVAPQDFPMNDTWELTASGWRPVLSFAQSPVNGHRYALTPPMSWPQAEALAVSYGGHLATVRNAAEHSWLWSTFGGQNSSPWIGLNDRAVEGQWVWSSGELESYRNWSPAEPNGGPSENCAHMYAQLGGLWNDAPDQGLSPGLFPGIIELPGGPTAPFTATNLTTSAPPPPLAATALAPLPTGGAVLFGGTTAGGPQPFTYTLSGSAFTPQFPFPQPAFRSEHAFVLDPARGNNVLFGGSNPLGTALNDTWTWANGQWTARQPSTAPSPRTRHRLTFAATTQTVELFGGVDASGADLGDHWQWNGTTWTQRTPATLPPARREHGLAFDARRQRLVLHGGATGASVRDDVWEWDGTTWAQVVPQSPGGLAWAPTARAGHAFAYDPRAERVVLHGGADAAGACSADVWSWDGAAWTRHTPTSQAPSARRGGTLFFDAAANELRLFAGACGTGFANDLWSLQLPVFARAEAYGAACVGSLGAPGLTLLPPSSPVVGTTMNLRISNVPGLFVPAIGAMGVSRTSWLGLPLPFELTPAGIPGCQLHQSAEVTLALTAPNGTGLVPWPIAIPTSPPLVGAELFFQALTIELPGFPRWSSLSNGLAIRIGSQ